MQQALCKALLVCNRRVGVKRGRERLTRAGRTRGQPPPPVPERPRAPHPGVLREGVPLPTAQVHPRPGPRPTRLRGHCSPPARTAPGEQCAATPTPPGPAFPTAPPPPCTVHRLPPRAPRPHPRACTSAHLLPAPGIVGILCGRVFPF
jgi:hypothetical protein